MLLFSVVIQLLLPLFIREQVIYEVGTLMATIEGIFIGLSPLISNKRSRDWVAVGLGIPALMVSILTVTIAYYQSIQLGYLSQDLETLLFRTDAFLFVLLVETYAIGILFSKPRPDDQPSLKAN